MSTATRVTHEGSQELPPEIIRMALRCKDRVETTKEALGIDNLNKTFELENGEQVYVVSNQFVSRVHIVGVEGYESEITETEPIPVTHNPSVPVGDFVCGVVTGTGMVETTDTRFNPATYSSRPLDLAPGEAWGADNTQLPRVPGIGELPDEETDEETTELSVYQISGLKQTEASLARFTDREAKIKLAVLPDVAHQPLTTPGTPNSQHAYIKSSMYTGYMRAVVQLLLGVGFVGPRTYETKWMEEHGEGYVGAYTPGDADAEPVESAFGLPKEWDEIGEQVQVKYDYRFNKSHGLGWGPKADGEPGNICYLIEIGSGGVYAMPLPLDPVSKLPQGRERYVTLFPELEERDSWGEGLIDKLGGFPTGESFPRHSGYLQDRVRAGEVIQLLSSEGMRPFYEGTFTSSVFGWVFQPNGGRADNICIKWSGSPGWRQGWHYSVLFQFNPFNAALDEPHPSYAEWLNDSEEAYLIKKAKRLTPEQYAEIMSIEGEDSEEVYEQRVSHLKSLTVESPLSGTANLQYKKHGDLYHPGRLTPLECHLFSGQPQIKFPEPLIGGLVSFDFRCEQGAKPPARCDAPIAVIGEKDGGIAVINYHYDNKRVINRYNWGTREPCQYTGSWEAGHASDGYQAVGNFYTSHIDLRKKLTLGSYHNTKTTGTLAGYEFGLGFCALFAMHSVMGTNVWHSYEWESESSGGKSYSAAIAMPEGDRNVYYTVEYEIEYGGRKGKGFSKPSMSGSGPFFRFGVIYHFVYHWAGHCKIEPVWEPGPKISCRHKEYRDPMTVPSCFPEAPQAPFLPLEITPWCGISHCYHNDEGCQSDPGNEVELPERFPGSSWSNYTEEANTIKYKVRLFGDTFLSGAVLLKDTVTGKRPAESGSGTRDVDFFDTKLMPGWFKPSPDMCGVYVHLNMTQSCWGNQITNYDEQVDAMRTKSYGTPEDLRSGTRATYVGYIK